ncbi:MAG: hypothetical protein H6Q19_26 [Bacteroidetes bacterium]|nr:hypothetical protein [Bacteroidota bacterium]HNX87964.1 permease-like cell division protein FtsX [Paludibacteraceae bacterium]HPT43493.1 permease-like cell division protein FtsX [Paludibacteraceae bacterium]
MSTKKYKKRTFRFRNANLTATFSMSLVLFLVGLLTLTLFLARDMTRYVKENLNLSIVLSDEITPRQTERIKKFLEKSDYAKSVELISKEQALQEHIQDLGENPEEFLGFNPLLASLEVKLNENYANTDSVAKIEKKLSKYKEIQKVSYQKDMISMVNENIKKISIILLGIAAILMLISFALINNTVRLSIYSNRFLINTMKLVGATHWFIRKPYVRRSVLNGIIAAIIALGLLTGLVFYFQNEFGLQSQMITRDTELIVAAVVIVLGILLTAISSYFAVGRYLRMRSDDMYYI